MSSEQAPTKDTVLVLAKGFPPTPGGVEQYSLQVVEAYLRRGLNVTVLTQTDGPRGWTDRRAGDNQSFRVWNAGAGSQPATFLRMILEAVAVRRRGPVHQVHATTWRVGLVALVIFRTASLVVTVHGREVLNFPRLMRGPMKSVLARADLVLAVSAATLDLAKGALGHRRPRGRWVVSYNGLTWPDTAGRTLEPKRLTSFNILSLSRLVPRKNIDGALSAVDRIVRQQPINLTYRIAGTGPERESLQQHADDLDLQGHVEFLGYVDDDAIPELYRWADVFLHPHTHVGEGNDFEGFGLVIADAMSFECAVIVGDAGGPRELVDNSVTGLLVDGADVESIQRALERLISNETETANMGRAARSDALERFSWDKHVEEAVSIFARHTEGREGKPR